MNLSRVLTVAAISVFACVIAGQQAVAEPLVAIENLKDHYRINEPISFTLKKTTKQPIDFACAAEKMVDGKVILTNWDISRNVYKLVVREPRTMRTDSLDLKWDAPNLMKGLRPEAGRLYRLRIDIMSPTEEHIYSTPFSIERD
jgi:hypothetical protein